MFQAKKLRDNFFQEKSIELLSFFEQLNYLYDHFIHTGPYHDYEERRNQWYNFRKKIKEEYREYTFQLICILLENLEWANDQDYFISDENKEYFTYQKNFGRIIISKKYSCKIVLDDINFANEESDNVSEDDKDYDSQKRKLEKSKINSKIRKQKSDLAFLLHCKWYCGELKVNPIFLDRVATITWKINYEILKIVATYLIRVDSKRLVELKKYNSIYSNDILENITSFFRIFFNKNKELPKFYKIRLGYDTIILVKKIFTLKNKI